MSYQIVKSIKIDEQQKKVFINSACNNVRPLTYDNVEFPYFSKILQEEGLKAVEIALLKAYEEGTLQRGNNKFSRALKIIYNIYADEYKKYNWSFWGNDEQRKENELLRNSDAFKEFLWKALNTAMPKTKFLVYKYYSSCSKVYVRKETKRKIFFGEREQAKVYDFEQEAKRLSERHNYIIEELTA